MAIFDLDRALQSTGKALPAHPAFMDQGVPVAEYSVGKPRKDAVISQREAARHADAYGGGQAIDWVYDCVNLYADSAGSADYRLEKKDGTRLVRYKTPGTPPEYDLGPQALYDLLDQPNPYMVYDELISLLVIDLLLVGNAYWYKWRNSESGRPLSLFRIAPSQMKIKPGPYGPEGYEYQIPGTKDKIVLSPSDVIHFRRPNPHSQWYGLGVIQGAGRAMDLELAVTDTMASYYENKAEPSLIIQSERRVPRDIFAKLRSQIRARAAGSGKSGEMLILEQGLTATSVSATAASAMFEELSRMSRDRILTKFRVSPMLLGILDETSGSNKVSDMRREFDTATLKPFFKRLSTQITIALADAYDVKYVIDHSSTLPVEEQLKVAESIAVMPYAKVREIRRQYSQFGIEESTGDTEIDNKLLNEPTPEADENGQVTLADGTKINSAKAGSDRPIGSEPGRPPKPGNTRSGGQGKALVDPVTRIEEALAALEAKAISTPAPDNRLPGEQRPDDPFSAARTADLNTLSTQTQSRLAAAASDLERALLDHVEGKALKTSDLVSRVRNSPAWRDFRATVKDILHDTMTKAAASGVMHSGLNPDEDVDYDEIAETVLARKGGLNDIVKTLKNRVVGQVKDARDADGERHEFNAAIQNSLKEWSTGSARTIADTEATRAYNEATLTAAELSGITEVFVTDGDDSDEPCQQADGSTWSIEVARENPIEHPNCRRAFLAVA